MIDFVEGVLAEKSEEGAVISVGGLGFNLFLSSQTLGVMLNLHKKIGERKGWFGVCGLKQDLHKVFKLTRLDKLFNFYDNEEQALRAVGI